MIDLLITCVLDGLFEPPQGWALVKAFSPPRLNNITLDLRYCPNGCPQPQPYVVIKRTVEQGYLVEIPKDCTNAEIQKKRQ